MKESELFLGFHGEAPAGWRLDVLEMSNWGTFGGARVHTLAPETGWTLLVGENGSGKSTAIDALRTLLAPRAILRGSFNDAAGGQGRRDRTLASYIRGQWSASREEEGTKPQFLRQEDEPSCLLAVFRNAATGGELTLAQVLWVSNGTDHTVFLVAAGRKGILADLQSLGSGREMKRKLRERGFAVYDGYAGYARDFQGKMGMPGDGAMEVFNQAIGVKEVVSVKQFLRSHLLARGDAVSMIRERVIPQFASLEDCWNSIQRDKERIKLLHPIVEFRRAELEAEAKKRGLDRLSQIAPAHYNGLHLRFLDEHIRKVEQELARLAVSLEETARSIDREVDRAEALQRELDGHEDSARIRELDFQIRELELSLGQIRKTRQVFDTVTRRFELGVEAADEAGFLEIQAQANSKLVQLRDAEARATSGAEEAGLDRRRCQEDLSKTQAHFDELERRRVLIDPDFLAIRDRVCEEFHLDPAELPFAGELIEVKPECEDWHGAIERLMRGFGISLLVPEHHYRAVAGFINRARLTDRRGRGMRMTFHRIPKRIDDDPPSPREETVPACLNFREEHPMSKWVRGEVFVQFPHRCCRDVAALEAASYGITREGLIRGGTRHIKDDRREIHDRTAHVLGWSPEKKLAALAAEIKRLEHRLRELEVREAALRREAKEARDGVTVLEGLVSITAYSAIDLSGGLGQLERLKEEKAGLESRSEDRLQLEGKLRAAKKSVEDLRGQKSALEKQQAVQEAEAGRHRKRREDLARDMPSFSDLPSAEELTLLAEIEDGAALNLDTVERVSRKVTDTLRNRSSQQQARINSARAGMGAPMQRFLAAFPEDSKDLSAEPDYADDFVRIHTRVVRDDLPVHEDRFRTFLNDNLTQNIASLDAGLSDEVKGHRRRIAQVNAALRRLDYSTGSYVEIDVRERGEAAVSLFRKQLRAILGMGMQLDDEARLGLFEKIRSLIEELKKPDWTNLVADGRNWLDFGIRECRQSDGTELDYFDSSQGKSGGQKAKLAFTILAAALCAQYGLAEDAGAVEGFRLVVIDEIFARTDEANSRRALELFRAMGFQLILAAPWEAKVRIAEPFVDSYHLAVNPEHNGSAIHRATREAYEEAAAARRNA